QQQGNEARQGDGLERAQRSDDEAGAARRNARAEGAPQATGSEQCKEQNRQREDWMSQQQRQVLQQRELDADESEPKAGEVHDRRAVRSGTLVLRLSERSDGSPQP